MEVLYFSHKGAHADTVEDSAFIKKLRKGTNLMTNVVYLEIKSSKPY
jgi:hypothetical protein